MKELSIEEKAHRYDEAKYIMNEYLESGNAGVVTENTIKKAFPELIESEDERIRKAIIKHFKWSTKQILYDYSNKKVLTWLERQGEQKHAEWSEEDEVKINRIVSCLENLNVADNDILLKDVDWLKSLRPQLQWKPSEEMLEALYKVISKNVMTISEDEMLLDKLYQGLKYGRVLSKN